MSNTISRRELERHGEPLGDSVTRPKLGGGWVCGFGGSSKSSSSNTTNNYDQRVAVQDGVGVSGDANAIDLSSKSASGGGVIGSGNSLQTTTVITDSGIVSRALDSIDKADAIQGQGFADLLQAAGDIYAKGQTTLNMAGDRIADAWQSASTEKAGTIDNKTIIALAVAGVVAAAVISRK